MHNSMRRSHDNNFKFKVAIEAINGQLTVTEICQKYNVHPSQIHKWKRILKEEGASIFGKDNHANKKSSSAAEVVSLHAKIGELLVERDFLKKVLSA